ncbi:MAG: phage tail tape measure protein [Actinoplanes sp.]
MARSVMVKFGADITDLRGKLREGGTAVRQFSQELDKAAKADRLSQISDQAGTMGIGVAAGFGYAIKSAMDFDKQMSAVSAALPNAAGKMDQLRQAALQAGKDTKYSATEAAAAITELGKAGVDAGTILQGGLSGALNLAAAGQMDVAEAAETAASAMTQFKLKGKDVPHIADLLAAAAGKAQGSVHDMGMALNQAGLVAAQTGLSIEETTGGLAAFANAGLIGSDAGTSFKQMLLMLQAPSDKSKQLMEELGITLYDSQGKFIGLSKFAGNLKTALKDLTPEARAAAMAQIFGADATRAASIVYENGAEGIQKWVGNVDDAGYASETAAKLTNNLAGDIERLTGSIQTLAIESGSGASGGLRTLVKTADNLVNSLSGIPGTAQSVAVGIAGVTAAVLLSAAAMTRMKAATAGSMENLAQMGPRGEKAAKGLERVSGAAGKAVAGLVALQVASAAMGESVDPKVDALTSGMEKFAATGEMAGETARIFGKDSELMNQALYDLGNTGAWSSFVRGAGGMIEGITGIGNVYDKSLQHSRERIGALDSALGQLVTQGNAPLAAQVFKRIADNAAASGVSVDEVKKVLPGYAAALEVAATGGDNAAGAAGNLSGKLDDGKTAQDKYTTAATAAAAAIKGEAGAFQVFTDLLKAEADPIFGMIAAEKKRAESLTAYQTAVKKHGRNSKEAKEANLELAQSIIAASSAAAALGTEFNGKLTPELRKVLRNNGMTEASLKTLEAQFGGAKTAAGNFAGDYAAKGSAPGVKNAKKEFEEAWAAALGFEGDYKAKGSAPGVKSAGADILEAWNKANGFDGDYKARMSAPGAPSAEAAAADAWAQAKGFEGKYTAKLFVDGEETVDAKIADLLIKQRQLSTGLSYSAARGAVQKDLDRNRQGNYDVGGWTGPGSKFQPAGIVHADEFVIQKSSRQQIEAEHPGLLDHMNRSGRVPVHALDGGPGYALGGHVWPFPMDVSKTKIPELAVMGGSLGGGSWPKSPSAVRGDSGRWRKIKAFLDAANLGGSFGNGYRPGDPKWHGSGWAVDWMGFNLDALASRLAAMNPLELIHRTRKRDYAYTRGKNKGSFNEALMNAHRNHIHIAMAGGGVINEHVVGVGRSGATYEFGERGPETVVPGYASGGLVNVAPSTGSAPSSPAMLRTAFAESAIQAKESVTALTAALKENGRTFSFNTAKGQANNKALIAGIKAAQDAAKAKYEETGSVAAANKVYDQYVHQLNLAMQKQKMSQAQRQALLRQYSSRPGYDTPMVGAANSSKGIAQVQALMGAEEQKTAVAQAFAWTKPSFNYKTDTGRAEIAALISYVQAAGAAAQGVFDFTGDSGKATKVYNEYLNTLRATLRKWMPAAEIERYLKSYAKITLTKNRMGGVYTSAAGGSLKEAMIASGGPTMYAWAEPETGGELFAPKNGNLSKTRREVGWAVQNWWGGQVSWQKGGNGGGAGNRPVVIDATIPITLGAETITRQVRIEVDTALGQVANATVYQTA